MPAWSAITVTAARWATTRSRVPTARRRPPVRLIPARVVLDPAIASPTYVLLRGAIMHVAGAALMIVLPAQAGPGVGMALSRDENAQPERRSTAGTLSF